MDASMISRMKPLEDDNRRLKRMYADLGMQADLLKEALGKNEAAIHCSAGKCMHLPRVNAGRSP
jgi:putative transposase